MTLDLLSQYQQIKGEIKTLEPKIKLHDREQKTVVVDSVKGSSPEFPYVVHSIPIAGYPNDRKFTSKRKRLEVTRRNRLAKLLALEVEIEECIDSISDSQLRQIITYRFIDGLSWNDVANEMGGSPDSYRMALKRYFKNCSVSSIRMQ